MPAAPSLEKLFDTQAVFEAAFAAYLEANGLGCYTSRVNSNMPDARIICSVVPSGSVAGHQATATTSKTGQPEQDMFTATIEYTIGTERAVVPESPVAGFHSIHDYNTARLKVLMLRGALNGSIAGITPLSLPYHRLIVLTFANQTPTLQTGQNGEFDETTISWNATYQILADAWPAAATP